MADNAHRKVFEDAIRNKALEYLNAFIRYEDSPIVSAHYDSIYEIAVLAKNALEAKNTDEEEKVEG